MRISFKYAILAPIFGVLFLVGLYFGAPIILSAIGAVTAAPVPTNAKVCEHLASIQVDLKDCPAWLEGTRESMGEYYDNRQRCFMAAKDQETALGCDKPIEYMTDKWE